MTLDLTQSYPRSVHHKLFGVVQIARTLDKAKAAAGGTLGEYDYNCPMDKGVFGLLGIDHEALLDVVKNAKTDAEIEAYVKSFVDKKSSEEIERFNHEWVTHQPEGDSLTYFLQLRNAVAPERTDVTSWPDLLDLDEKRTVPVRQTTNA